MGLCNDNIKFLRDDCKLIDQNVQNETAAKLIKVIKMLENRARTLQDTADRYYDCVELLRLISLRRISDVISGQSYEAEKKADRLYKKKNKQPKPFEDRNECESMYCLIFPVDARYNNDAQVTCSTCTKKVHILCEGLTELSISIRNNLESFKCMKCLQMLPDEIPRKFEKEIESLKSSQRELFEDINNYESKVCEKNHELELLKGPCEKKLDESFKLIGIAPMACHGGALNGKGKGSI